MRTFEGELEAPPQSNEWSKRKIFFKIFRVTNFISKNSFGKEKASNVTSGARVLVSIFSMKKGGVFSEHWETAVLQSNYSSSTNFSEKTKYWRGNFEKGQ